MVQKGDGVQSGRGFQGNEQGAYMHPMTTGRGAIDEPTREQIRLWIKYEMERRQIDSIREFARRVHANHAYISRVLNGDLTPGIELVLRMRKYLHVSVDAMLDGPPPGHTTKKS